MNTVTHDDDLNWGHEVIDYLFCETKSRLSGE